LIFNDLFFVFFRRDLRVQAEYFANSSLKLSPNGMSLAIKRWACGPFCDCCPARHAVVASLART
jgi:hypothetical protein